MGNINNNLINTISSKTILNAILIKDTFMVNYLIYNKINNYNTIYDENNNTLAHYLLKYNYVDIFIDLVQNKKLNYHSINRYGHSSLDLYIRSHFSNEKNLYKILDVMQTDLNINHNNNYYFIHILSHSLKFNNILMNIYKKNIIKFNISSIDGYYPIHFIVMNNAVQIIEYFLTNKTEESDNKIEQNNYIDYYINTHFKNNIMHYVSYNKSMQMLRCLHKNQIDIFKLVNSYNNYNTSPITLMCDLNNNEMLLYLIEHNFIDYELLESRYFKQIIDIIKIPDIIEEKKEKEQIDLLFFDKE